MKVLVLIPVYNPPVELFTTTIPRLKSQTIIPHIHLVSSSGELPSGDFSTTHIDKKDFHHALTRNMALSFSSDFYLFMTQDALPLDNFLIENLINSLENQKLALAYARQIPREDASPLEKFSRLQNYPENSLEKFIDDIPRLGIKTFFSSNSCAIYCADIFKKFGGFSPSAHVSEDMHFAATAMKAGYGISYCAKAQVYHSHNYTLSDLYVRYKNIGSFFKKNYWLLDMTKKNVSLNQTGLSFVSLQLKYLLRNQPLYVLRLLIETAIKYIAYKKGMLGEQK